MHGLNYSSLRAIAKQADSQARNHATAPRTVASDQDYPADSCAGDALFRGFRNLFPFDRAEQKFGHAYSANRDETIARLAHRMRRGARQDPDDPHRQTFWPDQLDGGTDREDNPRLPSGYTYLLQLIAHDIVASSRSMTVAGHSIGIENTRSRPMVLETIYGHGPEADPRAYEFSDLCRKSRGQVPRTRLRVGQVRCRENEECSFNDIGRARGVGVADTGIGEQAASLTEALIADPRNDDHALISQLVLLFHRLHNELIRFLDAARPVKSNGDNASNNFLCTRAVVTLIYRHILVRDVLQRLLHPDAYAHYVTRQGALVTSQNGQVPLEFAVGAFRCGHAMLRDTYQVNSDEALELRRGLDQSALRNPSNVPVSQAWVVEWKRFFEIDATKPNYSRRLGPNSAGVAHSTSIFPAIEGNSVDGLPTRDLFSAAEADLWSVPALIARLRQDPNMRGILPAYEKFKGWLEEPTIAGVVPLLRQDIEDVVADPPMPFFILFEAAYHGEGGATGLAEASVVP